MRRIFKDERHERLFNRDGCVLIKALDDAAITRIEEFYLANSDQDFTGIHNSMELQSSEQKAKIHKFLAQVFDEYLSRYFDDYKALVGGFSSKKSEPGSVVGPHRDWQLVNEAEYTALNLLAPLCDTNADNGAVGVFKGSHRLKQTVYGTNLPPTVSISDHYLKYLTFFHMRAGEVLLFATQTIHASTANKSGRQRTAVSIGIIPSEAKPIHYVADRLKPLRVLELEVDEDFYHNYYLVRSGRVSPADNHIVNTGGYRSREIQYTPARIEDQDIRRLYEPRGITAFREIKDRLKAKIAFR